MGDWLSTKKKLKGGSVTFSLRLTSVWSRARARRRDKSLKGCSVTLSLRLT